VLWPKRRILEVYLNFAEFGPGVFGVGAASRLYFGEAPRQLDREQAARLAAVLPNPHKIRVVDPGPWAAGRAGQIEALVGPLGGPAFLPLLLAPAVPRSPARAGGGVPDLGVLEDGARALGDRAVEVVLEALDRVEPDAQPADHVRAA